MAKFLVFLGAVTLVGMAMLVWPLVGALSGALSGWVVGWFFSETILSFFATLGIQGLAMWQIGLCLGFVGGSFKSTNIKSK